MENDVTEKKNYTDFSRGKEAETGRGKEIRTKLQERAEQCGRGTVPEKMAEIFYCGWKAQLHH